MGTPKEKIDHISEKDDELDEGGSRASLNNAFALDDTVPVGNSHEKVENSYLDETVDKNEFENDASVSVIEHDNDISKYNEETNAEERSLPNTPHTEQANQLTTEALDNAMQSFNGEEEEN